MKNKLKYIVLTILTIASLFAANMLFLCPEVRAYTYKDITVELGNQQYYTGEILPDTTIWSPNYLDAQGNWQNINNQIMPDGTMTQASYNFRLLQNTFNAGRIVEFKIGTSTVQLQPMTLEWSNNLSQISEIAIPANVTGTITNTLVQLIQGVNSYEGRVTWNNAYGAGRDFSWTTTPRTLKKLLTIPSCPTIPQYVIDGGSPYLRLNLIFAPSTDLEIYVDNVLWTRANNSQLQTFERIDFRKAGTTLFYFAPFICKDSAGSRYESIKTVRRSGQSLYVDVRVPYSWLQTATYPVLVDADITIESAATFYANYFARGGIFWTSPTVGYVIYIKSGDDLVYRKTSDGGATWGAAVSILAGVVYAYDCYADWQVAGDAGTKIHIALTDSTTDDLIYASLDTATDTLVTDSIATPATLGDYYNLPTTMVSITKTRGGKIDVAAQYWNDAYTVQTQVFYTSPDGDTWTSKTSPWEASPSSNCLLLYPANLADNNDIWAVFLDITNSAISLKTYDDSANSWSEAAIAAMTNIGLYLQFDGAVRLSDGHLILVYWNLYDNAAADLYCWDITDKDTITAKTNLITNTSEYFLCSVLIDQNTDDVYVAYVGGAAAASDVHARMQHSHDGGGTWSGDAAISVTNDDHKWISAGAIKATWGGNVMPVWCNDDTDDILCNVDNSVAIAAAGGEEVIDITATPTTYSFGIIDTNTTYSTGKTYFSVNNTGTSTVRVDVSATDWTGTGASWTLTDDYTNGYSTIGMKAWHSDNISADIVIKKNAPFTTLVAELLASSGQTFGYQIITPTEFPDQYEKSCNITLEAY